MDNTLEHVAGHSLEIDQSYPPATVAELKSALAQFPVVREINGVVLA